MNGTISDEMGRLQIIRAVLGRESAGTELFGTELAVEAMDDAALIKISDTHSLAITSDFVRGSGFYLFELGHLDYYDVGYYLIAANVSDIAAMGARPIGLTTVIRYSKEMSDDQFTQIFRGMKAAADAFGTQIIGGDIGGYVADVFAATALGIVKTNEALLRRNVQTGDLLCVTGIIGKPITALTYFKETRKFGFQLTPEDEKRLLLSWRRPVARVKEGTILSENRLANACQDVSDGLKATIEQMSDISGKSFTIYADRLPIDATTVKMADFLKIDPVQIAISASVDFELMFTIPPAKLATCSDLFRKSGCGFTVIGEVNTDSRNEVVYPNGKRGPLPGVAWKQQTGDYLKEIIGPRGEKA